jgi:hypothetical protein
MTALRVVLRRNSPALHYRVRPLRATALRALALTSRPNASFDHHVNDDDLVALKPEGDAMALPGASSFVDTPSPNRLPLIVPGYARG